MAAENQKTPGGDDLAHEPIYRRTARTLAHLILSGQLAPGTRLDVEREMAVQYGLSRNTLRSAFAVLEAQGLVRRVPRRGVFVLGEPAEKRWFSTASTILFVYVGVRLTPIQPGQEGYYGSVCGGAIEMARALGLPLKTQGVTGHVRVPLREYRPPRPDEVGGVILCGTFDEQYIRMYGSEGVPVVVVDYWTRNPHADSVIVDVEGEADTALDHLALKGHSRVGFCAVGRKEHGDQDVHQYDPDIPRMLDCLRRAAQRYRVQMRDEWIVLRPWSQDPLREPLGDLLRSPQRPTGMICFTDLEAGALLRAVDKAGLRCPEDISVVARGQPKLGRRQMTCLQSDPVQMGRMAVRLLLERMQGRRQQSVRMAMVSRLVLGTSTSFAPGAPDTKG